MKVKLISVDCGRHGIKASLYENGKVVSRCIPQLYADIDMDIVRRSPILNFERSDLIASVMEGNKQVFGETCQKFLMPDDIQYVTRDKMYVEHAIKDYVLIAIADLLTKYTDKSTGEKIILSFSVTSNTVIYSDLIVSSLKGKKSVEFFDNAGKALRSANFEIDQVKIVYQGHMAYLDYAIDGSFSPIAGRIKDTVVLDFGRRTLDSVYIQNMGSLKNVAIETMGTESLLESIAAVFLKYGVIKQTNEIETILLSKKYVFLIDGKHVDLKVQIEQKISQFVEKALTKVLDNFGGLTPDCYLLAGGGALLFGNTVKEILAYGNNVQIVENPVLANCNGALKIMVRKYGKEKI